MNKSDSTVELIEDCLEQIYRSRKSMLIQRANKYKQRQEQKRARKVAQPFSSNFDYDSDEDESTGGRSEATTKQSTRESKNNGKNEPVNNKKEIVSQNERLRGSRSMDDEEDDDLLAEITAQTSAPPLTTTPYRLTPYRSRSIGGSRSQSRNSSFIAPTEGGGEENIESSPYDSTAEKVYMDFCVELQDWMGKNGDGRFASGEDADEIRGDFCDHLIDKYLSHNLDALPATKKISSIRRMISDMVEEFASTGVVAMALEAGPAGSSGVQGGEENGSNINAMAIVPLSDLKKDVSRGGKKVGFSSSTLDVHHRVDNGTAAVHDFHSAQSLAEGGGNGAAGTQNVVAAAQAAAAAAARGGGSGGKQRDGGNSNNSSPKAGAVVAGKKKGNPPLSKEALEKQKIKEQYMKYIQTKKEVESHPDQAMVQEYSDLNDDIRSLLTSIQKKK